MKYILPFLLSLLVFQTYSQRNILINRISDLQIVQDSFYQRGLFPSQRVSRKERRIVEDNNIFFTGLIVYTLKSIEPSLPSSTHPIIDRLSLPALATFGYYKNRKGRITYNFYQVRPRENPFPNAKFLRNSKRLQVADDLDATSILYLAQNSSDSTNIALKKTMIEHSEKGIYTSSFKQFRKKKVYKTWFAEKMTQDIDICVLSNVLLFMHEKGLPKSAIDSNSYDLIKSSVQQDLHLSSGHLISSHYQHPSIILYHIARLMSETKSPLLDDVRAKIIEDIRRQMKSADNGMEQVILLTSLFRLGEQADFEIDFQSLQKDMNSFYWFKANPFYGSRFWIRRLVGKSNFLQSRYKSEAYYWSLVLELEALSKGQIVAVDNEYVMFKK